MASTVTTTQFSTRVTNQVYSIYGRGNCWFCGRSRYIKVAPVVQDHDTAIYRLEELGLASFNVDGLENAINLCSVCHEPFGDELNPAWVFLPTDLQYFVQFEEQNREERLGTGALRRVPSATDYLNHQKETGTVEGTARHPMYIAYILNHWSDGLRLHQRPSKPWHGAPITSIRRGIHALGSLYVYSLPPDVILQLRRLQELYLHDLTLPAPSSPGSDGPRPPPGPPPAPPRSPPPPPSPPAGPSGGSAATGPAPKEKKRPAAAEKRRITRSTKRGKRKAKQHQTQKDKVLAKQLLGPVGWMFGPDSTSSSKIEGRDAVLSWLSDQEEL